MKRFLLTLVSIVISYVISAQTNRGQSLATDYFRSAASGDWGSASTWESSSDNVIWGPATISPDDIANTITIRNGHNVSLTVAVTVDQVVIEGGGILTNQMPASNTLTIANGAGDDIEIQSLGVYHILSTQGFVNYQTINSGATIRIKSGGAIRVGDGTLFGGSGNHSHAATSASYIWENNSFFEWNSTGSFATSGVTYFPDVDAVTIPVFKTLVNTGNVGANSNTQFNCIFEANGSITFTNPGIKFFRNGIRGTGNISESSSGKFVINGVTAELGGTGSLTLPAAGLEIGSASNATTVSLISSKTITGDISLISTNNTYVDLGVYNLAVSGTVNGGTINAYIKTSGTGYLIHPSVTSLTFPIGNSGYNPITISNGNGADYSARVIDGISPIIAFPTFGINRTWNIYASANTPNVTVSFQYRAADANVNVPQPQDMELLINTDPVTPGPWSIVAGNNTLTPSGSDPYVVTTVTPITISNSSQVRYALGKSGGWILPIDCIISTRAQRKDNTGIISWNVNSCAEVNSFEIQRSVGNSGFQIIGNIRPGTNETDFSFTDLSLANGTNLYRIKVNRQNGASKYSNTVAVLYNSNDILITSLAPNPVHNSAIIILSAAKQTAVDFKVFDMSGRVVKQWKSDVAEGNTNMRINVEGLPAGMYHILANSAGAKVFSRFIKQ